MKQKRDDGASESLSDVDRDESKDARPRIVASVSGATTESLLERAETGTEGADVVELRVDGVPARELDLGRLRECVDKPTILTCRSSAEGGKFSGSETERRATLERAFALGFDYVDVELATLAEAPLVRRKDADNETQLLVSVHDFQGLPRNTEAIVERAMELGADVVKLAAKVRSLSEALRLAECGKAVRSRGRSFVPVPMGASGTSGRLLSAHLGASLLYAAARGGEPTGEGQLGLEVLTERYRVQSITSATRVFGIVGTNVLDSLSPAMHNDFFRRIGRDAVYVPFQEEDLAEFVVAARAFGVSGLSVTHPYKREILTHLTEIDAEAARTGAVNTVVVSEGKWKGYNTDLVGVVSPLRALSQLEGKRAVIVGAGGAARAAAFALSKEGAHVRVLARRHEQARELAEAVSGSAGVLDELASEGWDILVNATPVGSRGAPVARLPLPAGRIRESSIVFDMVSVPAETPLLADAKHAGARVVRGVSMLVAQAVEQARLWTGESPSVEQMRTSAERALGSALSPNSSASSNRRPARDTGALGRYSRQILFTDIGEEGQARIRASNVLVVGVGALGSVAAEMLVRAGVAHLRVVDRDYVDESNLQRQSLFDESDFRDGLPKAIAAKSKLSRINSDVVVEGRVEDVHAGNVLGLFRGVDLVLDGTDNFGTRYLLNDASMQTSTPWIYAACVGSYGMSFPILPGKSACFRCFLENEPAPGTSPTCDTAGVIAPVVHAIAAVQVAEAMKILAGRMDAVSDSIVSLDVWSGSFHRFSAPKKRSDCPACGLKKWDYLSGDAESATATLCGRNAVQVRPARRETLSLSLEEVARRLQGLGEVRVNEYLLKARIEKAEIVLFRDGRAIVHGTDDPAEARSLYAKYVGS